MYPSSADTTGGQAKRKVDHSRCLKKPPPHSIPIQLQVQSKKQRMVGKTTSENDYHTIASPPRQSTCEVNHISQKTSSNATKPQGSTEKTSVKHTKWAGLRIVSGEELQEFVQSYLLIHRHDGMDILAELSPLEVYSANHLHDWKHSRLTGKAPYFPSGKIGPVRLHITAEADGFVDTYGKSFHVAREHSQYFKEHASHLPSLHQIQVLCQAIASHGCIDNKRAPG